MLTAFIVEDELLAQNRVEKLLTPYTQAVKLVGTAQNGKTAITHIEELQPDVLFLDIQLPDMTGFKVLAQLTYQPLVIFTTAYANYAIQAFENYSIDYLVKPFDSQRFKKAMDKLMKFGGQPATVDYHQIESIIFKDKKGNDPFALPVKIGNSIKLFDFENIAYLKAEDKYVRIFTKNGDDHLSERSLQKLEEKLPRQFIRVHRSFIVNITFIQEVQRYFKGNLILILNDKSETKITTGSKYVTALKAQIGL